VSNARTTTELADQLDALANLDRDTFVELDDTERAALRDAATRLRKGQGAVYTIGRLLAPFLGRLVKGKRTEAATMPVGTWPHWNAADVLDESRRRTAARKDGQA
jgi:hypothetical protein